MRRLSTIVLFCLCLSSCAAPPECRETETIALIHKYWLILLSGFSSAILFFIWKNLEGLGRIRPVSLLGIITRQVGDEKHDLGILSLSLAIFCWFISGLVSLCSDSAGTLLVTSVCSSLNSCFLLLFLRHLDKEDLPAGFRDYFPSRHTIWTVFIILFLVTLAIAGSVYARIVPEFAMLLPDLGFSIYTLYFIGFSFFHLLTARMKSMEIGILSAIPILVTLLAEVCRLLSFIYGDQASVYFLLSNQTLLFTYKPLLIISYFVLIYSWQLKRINKNENPLKKGAPPANPPDPDVRSNRTHYRNLGAKDWLILEGLARGEKATSIAGANPLEFPNGAKGVDDRISAIAREFQLSGQSQMKIVVTALKRGLLKLEEIP